MSGWVSGKMFTELIEENKIGCQTEFNIKLQETMSDFF